jgi:protein SCO1/2
MRWLSIGAAAILASLAPADAPKAALTQAELADVAFNPSRDAYAPLELAFTDSEGRSVRLDEIIDGRPSLLVMSDYTCHILCGPILSIAAASIARSGLVAGRDFNLIVVGIDARESIGDAAAMKEAQLGGDRDLLRAARFLTGDQATIDRLSIAIGYRPLYDADARRFAHPTDLLVLTARGRVSQALSALSVDPAQLRFWLVEAGEGRVGALVDRLHVLCYGLDPAHGLYNGAVRAALVVVSGLTLLSLCGAVLLAERRRRRPHGTARS